MSLLKKIYEDTLLNPEKTKISRKSLTMLVSFANVIALSWVDLITSMPALVNYRIAVPDYLIFLFAALATGQSVLTVMDKKGGKL